MVMAFVSVGFEQVSPALGQNDGAIVGTERARPNKGRRARDVERSDDRLTGDVASQLRQRKVSEVDVLKDFDEARRTPCNSFAAADEHCELVPFAVW